MKKTLLALALAGLSSTGAMAAEPAAAEPEYTMSGLSKIAKTNFTSGSKKLYESGAVLSISKTF